MTTRYWYDTEFLEDGRTIELISIGIVSSDGREYYAVNREVYRGELWRRIRKHRWLTENVVPFLPDSATNPAVRSLTNISDDVIGFLSLGETPELWADYGAYDHVALCQLWGPMTALPAGLPMFTNDIQQEAARLGVTDELPKQEDGQHNALSDARHCRTLWGFLQVSEIERAAGSE